MRWDVFGYMFGAVFGLAVIFCVAFVGLIPGFTLTSTQYAGGYSEAAFNRIRMGEQEQKVRATLGAPLSEFTNNIGQLTMIYSFYQSGGLAMHWKSRVIVLSNGVVAEKFSKTMVD